MRNNKQILKATLYAGNAWKSYNVAYFSCNMLCLLVALHDIGYWPKCFNHLRYFYVNKFNEINGFGTPIECAKDGLCFLISKMYS